MGEKTNEDGERQNVRGVKREGDYDEERERDIVLGF